MRKQEEGEAIGSIKAKKITRFALVGEDLYRRRFTTLLIKYILLEESQYVLDELHNNV